MATIKTVMTYPLDGSTTDFNIPFEYLARKFVAVTLIGQDRRVLVLNQDYRFATKTTISTLRAWGPADGYNLIEIRRYTSATERLVDFTDGSILRAYDLNISQIQTLHVAEEARDLTADTIGVNNNGDLDARGRRIVNLADAKDPGDAINLGQIQRWNDSALNSANRAQAEADRATARASEAATSAGNSAGSANLSRDWATKETTVADGLESSRTYALHSMTYRDASKVSADASAASAAAAKTSETNAKTSETNAKTSENAAADSKTKAEAARDKAIEEAGKLENNNKLAGAVDVIYEPGEDPENPQDPLGKLIWKYGNDAPVLRAYQGMSIGAKWDGKDEGPFVNWYRGKGELKGTMRIGSGGDMLFENFPSVTTTGPIYAQSINSRGNVQADADVWANGGLFARGDTIALRRDSRWHLSFQSTDGQSHMFIYKDPNSDLRINNGIEGGGDYLFDRGGGFHAPAAVYAGQSILHQDGNIQGPVWGGFINNWVIGQIDQRVNPLRGEVNHRIHEMRRGGVQEHYSNGQNDWEAPWGYVTGYRNPTGDGNIKWSTWIVRQPQAYSNSRGWFDIGGNA